MVLLLATLLAPSVVVGEGREPSVDRPRICLALGGGGTRGVAHLGVIQVLEELQVPVDCIVGTSMGAVVGGLYAAGHSPAELEAALARADWQTLIQGRPPRRSLSFRRKQDDRRYPANFEVGFEGGDLKLPRGVLSTVNLDFLLQRLTLRVAEVRDFDHLPIPFRAVALDVAAGEKVVLDSGNLATAIRASMSVPGAFPPVPYDGRLLVDGSVVDNLPVAEALTLGADVVIAVDVGTPLLSEEDLSAFPALLGQALSVVVAERTAEQRRLATEVLAPDLGGYGEFDFSDLDSVVIRGREEARRHDEVLSTWSDAGAFETFLERQRRSEGRTGRVRRLSFEGAPGLDRRRLAARFRTAAGEPLDLEMLRRDLVRVHQLGAFDRVAVDLQPVAGAADYDVLVRLRRQPGSENLIRTGLAMADDLEGDTSLNLLVGFTRAGLNALGGELRTDFQAGRTRRAFSELYQPLGFAERLFVAPSVEYRAEVLNVFAAREKVAELDREIRTLALHLGWRLGNAGEARLGLRRSWLQTEVGVGDPTLPELEADLGGFHLGLFLDRLDSATVPRRGDAGELEIFLSESSLGADDEYTLIEGSYRRFFTRGRHTTFLAVAGGFGNDEDLPAYEELSLGGLFSFSGFSAGELRGPYAAVLRGGYYTRVWDLPLSFGTGVYLGGWLEAGNVWESSSEISTDDLVGSLTLAGAVDTRVGALYVALGVADDGRGRVYVSLGSRI